MLKHSISHYGQTGVPLQSPHQMGSSSHSGDASIHHQVNDPTIFLERPSMSHNTTHNHSHSHSYLDQSYPSIHNPIHNSRLFLESSRISRKDEPPLQTNKPMNGSIYFSPTVNIPQNPNNTSPLNETINTTANPTAISNPSNNITDASSVVSSSQPIHATYRKGVLRTLALLSVLSLLLALNSLIFLLKNLWPGGDAIRMSSGGEIGLLYEVTLCLTCMSLSINLCVLLVCSAQYFFAATATPGTTSFLEKVTVTRGVAIGGFFLSIPLFLCAIVLYTFTYLSFSLPALIATACVGTAIIFGGCSLIHNVFTWQKEKTRKMIMVPTTPKSPTTIELSTLV